MAALLSAQRPDLHDVGPTSCHSNRAQKEAGMTTIKTSSFSGPEFYGYLAEPDVSARGGVLILPTIFGVNDFARQYADTLAGERMTTAVWDINSGLPLTTDYQECIKRARTLTDAGVTGVVDRWLGKMMSDFGLSAVAVLGFCIGGRFALLQAARDKRLRGCAMAYPSIENPRLANQELDALALASDIACPVHVLRPGNDHVTNPETYEALTRALLERDAPTMLQIYPAAEHGFMHRKTPEANVAATVLASPQVIGFLKGCLS
jgi:carboxymethylenebutenolidase